MTLSEFTKQLEAAGATLEIVRLVLTYLDEKQSLIEQRRANDRDRKIRQRAKETSRHVTVTGHVTGHSADLSPSSSPSDGFPPSPYSNTIHPPSLTPSTPPSHTRLREAFDRFWKLYPKRTGKGAAEKSWAKATARLDPEVILSAVAVYPWPEDPQFIPHPATWLNQKRWEDEPASNVTTFTPKLKERDLRNIPDNLLGNDDYWKKRRQQKEGLR